MPVVTEEEFAKHTTVIGYSPGALMPLGVSHGDVVLRRWKFVEQDWDSDEPYLLASDDKAQAVAQEWRDGGIMLALGFDEGDEPSATRTKLVGVRVV